MRFVCRSCAMDRTSQEGNLLFLGRRVMEKEKPDPGFDFLPLTCLWDSGDAVKLCKTPRAQKWGRN